MITMEMAPTARMIMENVVALKKGESVCILTDTECPKSITEVLAVVASALGGEVARLPCGSQCCLMINRFWSMVSLKR